MKKVILILVSVFFVSTCMMAQEYTNTKESVLQKREEMRKHRMQRMANPMLGGDAHYISLYRVPLGISERKFKRRALGRAYLEGTSDDGSCAVYIEVREKENYFYFFRRGVLVKVENKPIIEKKKPKKNTSLYIGMPIKEFDEIMSGKVTLLLAKRGYRKYREDSYNQYGERNGLIYTFEKGRLYQIEREE